MLKTAFIKTAFRFKFIARTSRGVMKDRVSWMIKLQDSSKPGITGWGECAPLPGLSPDARPDFERILKQCFYRLENTGGTVEDIFPQLKHLVPTGFPSLLFGLETACLDLMNGGKKIVYSNSFIEGQSIPINGLVWMGDAEFMGAQIKEKIASGYRCLKLKIGGIDFEQECSLLAEIRKQFSPSQIVLRLDANGSFRPAEALDKLKELAQFTIHSIEQPIRAGRDEMAALCAESPIPIALDEELIGQEDVKEELLQRLRPPYIILKPTLHGGLLACASWIQEAQRLGIGWWITSALESNIGLNAICQFASNYPIDTYQGLGTGQLYENNIPSPLRVHEGQISYDLSQSWDLSGLD